MRKPPVNKPEIGCSKAFGILSIRRVYIRIDPDELPIRMAAYEAGIVVDLRFITGQLLIAIRRYASIPGNAPLDDTRDRERAVLILGGRDCRYFRHAFHPIFALPAR